jgi:hypothetical protein
MERSFRACLEVAQRLEALLDLVVERHALCLVACPEQADRLGGGVLDAVPVREFAREDARVARDAPGTRRATALEQAVRGLAQPGAYSSK